MFLSASSGFTTPPHLIEDVHIKRKGVQLTFIVGDRRIDKAVEYSETLNIKLDVGIIRMEDMSTILIDVNTFDLLGIHIASNMRTLLNHMG